MPGHFGKIGARSVRMRDVADLAGVGTMTVSRVLNGTARVSEETSSKVYRAIETLKYKPNQVARALRGSRSHTIGVLVPYLYDPFFATCAHAINEVAQSHGCSVILTTTNEDPATELEAVRQMVRRQVDGLIVIPAERSGSVLTSPEFSDLPIVTLDRPIPDSSFDSVQVKNKEAGTLATDHLIEHGHRRIAFVALSKQLFTMRTRLAGYEAAMRKAGLVPEAHFDCQPQRTVTELLRGLWTRPDRPTAIFAANGLTTRYTLQALAELGVEIPNEIALVGFDDFELAEVMRPPLTVVRQPVAQVGQQGAELLFARMQGDSGAARQRVVLPVELVVRGSCGCAEHPGISEASRLKARGVLA